MQMTPVDDNISADGLVPDDVSRWETKERFFRAMAVAVARSGYGHTAVADILQTAGMSHKTFYELFENKEDCFLQAYDAAVHRLRMVVGCAYHDADEWAGLRERVELGLGAFLDCCASEPELARMCIVEVLAAGEPARERRDAAILDFASFIEHPRSEARGTEAPSLVSEAIAGGIYGIVYSRVARGETELLPDLLDELMDSGLGQLVSKDAD